MIHGSKEMPGNGNVTAQENGTPREKVQIGTTMLFGPCDNQKID
jgi:hypothetical protein